MCEGGHVGLTYRCETDLLMPGIRHLTAEIIDSEGKRLGDADRALVRASAAAPDVERAVAEDGTLTVTGHTYPESDVVVRQKSDRGVVAHPVRSDADGAFSTSFEDGYAGQLVDASVDVDLPFDRDPLGIYHWADFQRETLVTGDAEPVVAEPNDGADPDFGIGDRGDGGEQPAEPVVAEPNDGADPDFGIGDRGDGGEQPGDGAGDGLVDLIGTEQDDDGRTVARFSGPVGAHVWGLDADGRDVFETYVSEDGTFTARFALEAGEELPITVRILAEDDYHESAFTIASALSAESPVHLAGTDHTAQGETVLTFAGPDGAHVVGYTEDFGRIAFQGYVAGDSLRARVAIEPGTSATFQVEVFHRGQTIIVPITVDGPPAV